MALTKEQLDLLKVPLPKEAIKPHPTKTGMSTINPAFVIERLNEVFGVGEWSTKVIKESEKQFIQNTKNGEKQKTMIVVKLTFEIPKYNVFLEQFGGNDNDDLGDAYKGATTDALTKIASYFGIGLDVWKNKKEDNLDAQDGTKEPALSTGNATPCRNCGKDMSYKEGVSKTTGKPYKMNKCPSCGTTTFLK